MDTLLEMIGIDGYTLIRATCRLAAYKVLKYKETKEKLDYRRTKIMEELTENRAAMLSQFSREIEPFEVLKRPILRKILVRNLKLCGQAEKFKVRFTDRHVVRADEEDNWVSYKIAVKPLMSQIKEAGNFVVETEDPKEDHCILVTPVFLSPHHLCPGHPSVHGSLLVLLGPWEFRKGIQKGLGTSFNSPLPCTRLVNLYHDRFKQFKLIDRCRMKIKKERDFILHQIHRCDQICQRCEWPALNRISPHF